MKKKILLSALFVFLPFKVNAANISLSVNCDKNVLIPSEEIKCTLDGEVSDGSISGFESDFNFDNNINVTKFVKNSVFSGSVDVEDKNISLYTEGEEITGKFNIGTLYIKASSNVSKTSNIIFTNSKFAVNTQDNVVDQDVTINPVSFRIASDNNLLSDIKINGKSIESFDPKKNKFFLDLYDEKITITATSADPYAKIEGLVDNKSLNYGESKFEIVVKSESGSENVYVIKITKFRDGELSHIIVDDGSLYFGAGEYEIGMIINKNSVNLDAEFIDDSLAEFVEGYGPRKIDNLKIGDNKILLKTIDKEGNILTYTINLKVLSYSDDSSIDKEEDNKKEENKTEDKKEENKTDNKKEDVKNPDTGVNVSIIAVLSISIIAVVSYVILRKKNYFKKI